jgi:hypothetical protein
MGKSKVWQVGRWPLGCLLFGRLAGPTDGRMGGHGGRAGGRCRALRAWKAFRIGADTQSGQINFTARRDNVICGVRLEMSAWAVVFCFCFCFWRRAGVERSRVVPLRRGRGGPFCLMLG